MNKTIIFILVVLLSLVVYKGVTISMTHDESASYVYLTGQSVIDDLFDKSSWTSANNHWLNTLSFKFFIKIFGSSEWVIRLFSMFCFLIYAISIYLLGQKIKSKELRLAFVLFCTANPYLLDFFSVARGYSSSIAFTTLAIYFAIKYLELNSHKFLYFMITSLIVATLALFSSIIFYPAIYIAILCVLYLEKRFERVKINSLIIIFIISILLLILLTYIPLTELSKNAEFKWGDPSLIGSFKSLASMSSYSQRYMPESLFIVGFTCFFLIYLAYKLIYNLQSQYQEVSPRNRVLLFTTFVFFMIIFFMVISRYVFGTYYPSERKTTMFVPLLGIMIFFFLDNSSLAKSKLKLILPLLIGFHFISSYNKDKVIEWWYDAETKNIANLIHQDSKNKNVTVACNWLFWPTLSFYSKTQYRNLQIAPNNQGLDTSNLYNYYFADGDDYNRLKNKYNVIYKCDSGYQLLKKK